MKVSLQCGLARIEVDPSVAEMSRPRVHVSAFETTQGPLALRIERVAKLQGGEHLHTDLGVATVRLDGDVLQVEIEDDPFVGELALRLGYAVVTSRSGGVLVHATGLRLGDVSLIACGKSGDGKSTLARLCTPSSTLLGDEVVQLFPDGRAAGTPFRSDFDNVGSPGLTRAQYFVGLRKAETEALEPLDAAKAFALALEQCFEPHAYALPRAQTKSRLMQFLSTVNVGTLAFRKDPAVAQFVNLALREFT